MQSLLRPLGEHIVTTLTVQPDDVCVDVGCDGAVMAALLARAGGRCVAVDDDTEVLAETRDELSMLHLDGRVALLRARGDALPLRDGCAQVVTSLFALPLRSGDPITTLREMLRVLDPQHGRLICTLWVAAGDQATPIAGRRLDTTPLLAAAGGRARIEVVRDVARFDGVDHYRAAVSGPEPTLTQWTAPDGTLRIPTQTVTLAVSPGR